MGDPRGFLNKQRQPGKYRRVDDRKKDFKEVALPRTDEESVEQASRCMDCGTPFCHWGCPVCNLIPEWNDLVFKNKWKDAFVLLDSQNILPEVTGRICPALCEAACVLGVNDDPVTIRDNEKAIIEYAFKEGLIKPNPPKNRTGKKVAVIGSGPSGISAANTLNRLGHNVTVFEKDAKAGGILRYGIPDFKLEKWILDRRISILKEEGIEFKTGVNVGIDYKIEKIKDEFDAVCIAIGSRVPRDINTPGRELKGVHLAMDYLVQANLREEGTKIVGEEITAKDKNVVIIGGGDTGADCVGVANRQGAKKVIQIELLEEPPVCRTKDMPWPEYPKILRTSTSHEEGCERKWCMLTKEFIGKNGVVKKIKGVNVEFKDCKLNEIQGSEFELDADLVILAMGFTNPEKALIEGFKLDTNERGNIKTNEKLQTSDKSIFSAGDAQRGASLIVWCIADGVKAAKSIDEYLK
ncbi:MAG: glutamate synthase subunit beta [Elusimicrobiota bacterium]